MKFTITPRARLGFTATYDGMAVGPKGDSAYMVAVENGFTGTEQEWLDSLKGEKGDKGDKGEKGDTPTVDVSVFEEKSNKAHDWSVINNVKYPDIKMVDDRFNGMSIDKIQNGASGTIFDQFSSSVTSILGNGVGYTFTLSEAIGLKSVDIMLDRELSSLVIDVFSGSFGDQIICPITGNNLTGQLFRQIIPNSPANTRFTVTFDTVHTLQAGSYAIFAYAENHLNNVLGQKARSYDSSLQAEALVVLGYGGYYRTELRTTYSPNISIEAVGYSIETSTQGISLSGLPVSSSISDTDDIVFKYAATGMLKEIPFLAAKNAIKSSFDQYYQSKLSFTPEDSSKKGASNGYAGLDSNGQVAQNIQASKIQGTIGIGNLPPSAIERIKKVSNQAARFALTTDAVTGVQNGDTVKEMDTLLMFMVVDDTNLGSENGYEPYTAGASSSTPWSGVTGVPDDVKNPIPKSLATGAGLGLISSGTGTWDAEETSDLKVRLGLGAAAYTDPSAYATAAQGVMADSAEPHQNKVSTIIGNEGDSARFPNTKAIVDYLNLFNFFLREYNVTSSYNSGSNGVVGYTYFMSIPVQNDGFISQFKYNASVSGDVYITVANIDIVVSTYTARIVSQTIIPVITGSVNVVNGLNIPVKKGNFIGVYMHTGALKYTDAGTNRLINYTGNVSSYSAINNNRDMDMGFFIYSDISRVAKNRSYHSQTALLENTTSFTMWTALNFSSNGGSLTSPKFFGLDNRSQEWVVKAASSNTKVCFCTLPSEGINAGSAIRVDFGSNSIQILSAYTGSLGSAIQSYTPSIALNYTKITKIKIVNSGRSIQIYISYANTLYDQFTEYTLIGIRYAVALGYTSYPSYGYDQGNMHGQSRVVNEANGVIIYSFSHYHTGTQYPYMYILGDSISEGFSVSDRSKFTSVLSEKLGGSSLAVSSIGGATAFSCQNRMKTEIPILKPKYVLIVLGANSETDSNFNINLNIIISYCFSQDCIPILCTVPNSSSRSAVVRNIANSNNLLLIDIASLLYPSGTINAAYYNNIDNSSNAYSDSIHPNGLGHWMIGELILSYMAYMNI